MTHQALLLHMSVKQWRRRRRSEYPRKSSENARKVGENAVVSMLTFGAAALEASAVTRAEFLSAILCIEEVGGWRIERRQRRRRGWREVGKRNSRTHIKVHQLVQAPLGSFRLRNFTNAGFRFGEVSQSSQLSSSSTMLSTVKSKLLE